MAIHQVESLDDPRLAPYRNLKATNRTRWSGEFVAEGKLVVQRLLESDFEVRSVLAAEYRLSEIAESLPEEVQTLVVPREVGARLVGFNFHAGLMAIGVRKPILPLSNTLERRGVPALWVAPDRVLGPENLGGILRISAAFGVDGVILGPGCADPFSRRVLRVSMGAALRLPIHEVESLAVALNDLCDNWAFQAAATVIDGGATPLLTFNRPDRLVVVFGNEAEGISEETLAACDRRITIPVSSRVDSLNVATAAGIVLYELAKRPTQ